jgi:uncharacterized protein YceH (UPF0502 family)
VHSALQRLSKREPPLVAVLPRQAGMKETRYAHLLGDADPVTDAMPLNTEPDDGHSIEAVADEKKTNRVESLANEVAQLRAEVADLREELATFRKQFE